MKQVTKNTFYDTIGNLDAISTVLGNFPYTTEFKLRNNGRVIGKVVDRISEQSDEYEVSDYYIA